MRIVTEETRRKISKTLKGRIPWNKGKTGIYSEETIRNISETQKGRIPWNKNKKDSQIAWNKGKRFSQIVGNKNGNWKGGITPLTKRIRNNFKYRQWRSDVFTRDKFTCQECGQWGGRLNAHHIKSFSIIFEEYQITILKEALECEELFNINNGITLCEECHQI